MTIDFHDWTKDRDICAEILAAWGKDKLYSGAFVATLVELGIADARRSLVVHGRVNDSPHSMQMPIGADVASIQTAARLIAGQFAQWFPKADVLSEPKIHVTPNGTKILTDCNCPGNGAVGGWHTTWCRSKTPMSPKAERTYEIKPNGPAITIDSTKAIACTCGARDGKHANTCGALSSPKVERARPMAELFDNVARLDGTWKVFGEMVERNRQTFARTILGVDPAVKPDEMGYFRIPPENIAAAIRKSEAKCGAPKVDPSPVYVNGNTIGYASTQEEASRVIAEYMRTHETPSLEWLARELNLDPNAPDDVVKATVRKRLAGQFAEYDSLSARNVELRGRVEDAQRRLEDALQDIAAERKENDELRGMVAEVQLENRKLRRGR